MQIENFPHPTPAKPIQEIFTRGTDREIGAQHAEQVGDSLNLGMPQFYFNFWQRMARSEGNARWKAWGMDALRVFIEQVVVRRMHREVPPWAFERVRGLCDVSGRPFKEMATALVLPDLFPLFEVWLAQWAPKLFIPVEFPPQFGCSSFFYRGEGLYFGRNLDFPGVGYWDRFPTIQLTEPKEGLRYIAFSSAGVPFGGITGINEDRISVALHQHYSRAGTISGKLPFLIAEQILMKARSLDEAIAILDKTRVATSWAFLLADGKSKQALIYECHSKARSINRLERGALAHANFYQTRSCRDLEFATSARMNWDNHCRKSRLDSLLDGQRGLSPSALVQVLGDHYDPFWEEEKPFNRTVSQVYNIQSLLFDMDNFKVWMAEGDAPVHLREFVEFDLGELFSGRSGRKVPTLPAYRFRNPEKRMAKECFIRSFIYAFDGKYGEAEVWLTRSLESDFSAEAGLILGVVQLKDGRFELARAAFEKVKGFIEEKRTEKKRSGYPPEYFETLIYLARCYDLLDQREKAEALYDIVEKSPECADDNFRRIARKRSRYEKRHLSKILMPYSSYIPFH